MIQNHTSAPWSALRRATLLRAGFFAAVALILIPAAAAMETAKMQLPPEFSTQTERIQAKGFGGRNKGQFELGPYHGPFTRLESRLGIKDPLFARKRGRSSFTLNGPGFDTPVSATCQVQEHTVTVGVVTFDTRKMVYSCTFTAGTHDMPASLVLGQAKHDSAAAKVLAKADRVGEATIDGVKLELRSVHRFAGSRITSPTPVGYLFSLNGSDVGGVELTDTSPAIYLPGAATVELRRAVLLAALALAVLRDPADSALED